jgi:hypothetical protein
VKKRKLEEGETVKEVVLAVRNRKTGGEGQLMKKTHLKFGDSDGSDSDEMYEDMPAAAAAVDAAPGGEALPTISVGDLMRLENNDDDDDDDDEEDDDDNVQGKDDDDDEDEDDDEEDDDEGEETEKKEKRAKKEKKEKKNEDEEKEEEKKEEEQVEEQDDTGRLFVRNLPFSASEDDLYKLFKKHGDISEVHIPIDRETKKPRGMAYVTFMLPEVAAQAHAALDGSIFQVKRSPHTPHDTTRDATHADLVTTIGSSAAYYAGQDGAGATGPGEGRRGGDVVPQEEGAEAQGVQLVVSQLEPLLHEGACARVSCVLCAARLTGSDTTRRRTRCWMRWQPIWA